MNLSFLPEGVIDNSMDRIVNDQRQEDAEEKWHRLWDKLFPDVVVPTKGAHLSLLGMLRVVLRADSTSVAIGFVAPVELDEVRAQFQDSLNVLKGRIGLALDKIPDRIDDKIATVISQDMELLFRDFISEVFQVCEMRSSGKILAGPEYLQRCLDRDNAIALQSTQSKSPDPSRQWEQISAMAPLQPRILGNHSPVGLPRQWFSLPYGMVDVDQALTLPSTDSMEIPLCGDDGKSKSCQMELDLNQQDEPKASSVEALTPWVTITARR